MPEWGITVPFGAALPEPGFTQTRKTSEHKQILFVGRLVERKGIPYLIEATAALFQQHKIKINIVGTGPQLPALKQLTRQLNLEDTVIFHGQVSAEQLQTHYKNCDIFVLPAIIDSKGDTEGLGVVIIEAMTYKKPVVASMIGGVTDLVINEQTGLAVPPGDSEALAKAIARLITDSELANRLAQAGYEHIQHNYSWQAIIDRLINLYQQILPVNPAR
jgi:glycosyltransferase involved in cell wall biosynthesis